VNPEPDNRLSWQGAILILFVFLVMVSCWLTFAGGKL
jgi:hypothetical protein